MIEFGLCLAEVFFICPFIKFPFQFCFLFGDNLISSHEITWIEFSHSGKSSKPGPFWAGNREHLCTFQLNLQQHARINWFINTKNALQRVSCRIFTVIWQYSLVANYNWIFIEGVYLHNLVFMYIFNDNTRITKYVIAGWGEFHELFLDPLSLSINTMTFSIWQMFNFKEKLIPPPHRLHCHSHV